jgi:membrane protein YdbS with pleckstrin-like domain
VFRSGRSYYHWRLALWLLANIGAVNMLIGASIALERATRAGAPWVRNVAEAMMVLLATAFLLSAFFTFLLQRLNYEMRWYVVTDRCLRIRGGILNAHEITTTFANIQEVRLSSGPLQKLLGLADVEVHSAGGGSGKGSSASHVARFEGVDNAPEIRDFILARLRHYRDSGLGEKEQAPALMFREGSLEAARAVLTEARALRAALQQ